MILFINDVSALAGQPWRVLELGHEMTQEQMAKRVGRNMPKVFGTTAAELFVPVIARDLAEFDLLTGNWFYVRSNDIKKEMKLCRIHGVAGLVNTSEAFSLRNTVQVEDSFVQMMIASCEQAHKERHRNVREGSFVRILSGSMRGYCGTVSSLGARAIVRVRLGTKWLVVDTTKENLIDLGDVPQDRRVFYYSPLVANLEDPSLLARDLREPVPLTGTVSPDAKVSPVLWRRTSCMAAVIRRLDKAGVEDPRTYFKEIAAAWPSFSKKPKSVFIVGQSTMVALRARGLCVQEFIKRGYMTGSVMDCAKPFFAGIGLPDQTPKGEKWVRRQYHNKPPPCTC